ncbi:stage V sporulation protein AA [Aquibacillus kalidii]|uniref:stage V sporulation protein AA n=1 Tax=Aquibacillus kalidii TaxID=2762597 RepID=UPI001647BA7D|nr:stage V sporulation protein AA [Aquibacillus kalidii]
MGGIIYLRLKKQLSVRPNAELKVKDIAYISGPEPLVNKVKNTFVYQITESDQTVSVIDGFVVVDQLINKFQDLDIQHIGPNQIIVHIAKQKKRPSVILVAFIWVLLFIGSAMAIMNFHYDVSMEEVQEKLHYMLTGKKKSNPLWMQIPYSFGLGIGMILFFNHLFKKRFNEEPSPLEVEIFKYQQDLDAYVTDKENMLNSLHDTNK